MLIIIFSCGVPHFLVQPKPCISLLFGCWSTRASCKRPRCILCTQRHYKLGFLIVVFYGCGLDSASWCWTSLTQNSLWRIKSSFWCNEKVFTEMQVSQDDHLRAFWNPWCLYWSLINLSNKISSYPVLNDIQHLNAWLECFNNVIGIDFALNEKEHHETCRLRHAQGDQVRYNSVKRAIAQDRMIVFAALMKSVSHCTKATWILSKHLKQPDPTAAYMSLLKFSTKWSKSRLPAKPYKDFMQSARIDDGTWLSTLENFILYWKHQHNVYQTESLRYDFFSDSELIAMLDATVCLIKELIMSRSNAIQMDLHMLHMYLTWLMLHPNTILPLLPSNLVGTCLEWYRFSNRLVWLFLETLWLMGSASWLLALTSLADVLVLHSVNTNHFSWTGVMKFIVKISLHRIYTRPYEEQKPTKVDTLSPLSLASTTFSPNNQYYPPLHCTTKHHQPIFLPKTTHHHCWQHLNSTDEEKICVAILFSMQFLVLWMCKKVSLSFHTKSQWLTTPPLPWQQRTLYALISAHWPQAYWRVQGIWRTKWPTNTTSLILPKRKNTTPMTLAIWTLKQQRKNNRSHESWLHDWLQHIDTRGSRMANEDWLDELDGMRDDTATDTL